VDSGGTNGGFWLLPLSGTAPFGPVNDPSNLYPAGDSSAPAGEEGSADVAQVVPQATTVTGIVATYANGAVFATTQPLVINVDLEVSTSGPLSGYSSTGSQCVITIDPSGGSVAAGATGSCTISFTGSVPAGASIVETAFATSFGGTSPIGSETSTGSLSVAVTTS
jgi:hypothetical protein